MRRNGINTTIKFRLENSRVRGGKRKLLNALKKVRYFGSFVCYKKKKCCRANRFHIK